MKKIYFLGLIAVLLAGCAKTAERDIPSAISKLIPQSAMLREVEFLPDVKPTSYLGIYVENPERIKSDEADYMTCPGEVKGQAIKGIYHLFLYQNGVIVNDLKIPSDDPDNDDEFLQEFPFQNTKINNFRFFNGSEPKPEDEQKLETTKLISLGDYNGDKLKYEFLLVGSQFPCGHVNRLVAGYDEASNKAIIYPIAAEGPVSADGKPSNYWYDSFIPDSTGAVTVSWLCGDHGNEMEVHRSFVFEKKEKDYVMKNYFQKKCE